MPDLQLLLGPLESVVLLIVGRRLKVHVHIVRGLRGGRDCRDTAIQTKRQKERKNKFIGLFRPADEQEEWGPIHRKVKESWDTHRAEQSRWCTQQSLGKFANRAFPQMGIYPTFSTFFIQII